MCLFPMINEPNLIWKLKNVSFRDVCGFKSTRNVCIHSSCHLYYLTRSVSICLTRSHSSSCNGSSIQWALGLDRPTLSMILLGLDLVASSEADREPTYALDVYIIYLDIQAPWVLGCNG